MGRGSSCSQWYMRAGGSGGCMGAGSPAAYMKAGGSAVYSRHVGEEVQQLTVGICMGQEVQLFVVGTWGQGITVWVHGGRVWVHGGKGQSGGPAACSGYMKAGGPIHVHGAGGAATYSG